ncbi:MAG: hypothetical protein WCH33_09355 [Betaproteobacteria bacterium]
MQLTFDPTAFINSIPSDLLLALGAFIAVWCLAMVVMFVMVTRK